MGILREGEVKADGERGWRKRCRRRRSSVVRNRTRALDLRLSCQFDPQGPIRAFGARGLRSFRTPESQDNQEGEKASIAIVRIKQPVLPARFAWVQGGGGSADAGAARGRTGFRRGAEFGQVPVAVIVQMSARQAEKGVATDHSARSSKFGPCLARGFLRRADFERVRAVEFGPVVQDDQNDRLDKVAGGEVALVT
jgi:hypothetical protein